MKSLDDQRTVMGGLARVENLTIIETLSESKSAKEPHTRPVYMQMIERIKRGEADGILCWHINRLVRNPVDGGELQWLLQCGVLKRIKTADREYLPDDNALLMAIETGVANQYIRDLRTVVRRAVREKAERGWWPFRPPTGYRINPDTKDVEPHPADLVLLRRAWDLMLTGAYTVPEVHEELTRWGFRVKGLNGATRPISRSSLYRLFSNSFYAGEFLFQGRFIAGRHQAMVSRLEFDQVQAHLKRGQKVQPQRHVFAFTGMIRCGVCGCVVTAETKVKNYETTGRKAVYTYYHCTGRRGCIRQSVSESYIHAFIGRLLLLCQVYQPMLIWARDALVQDQNEEASSRATVLVKRSSEEEHLRQRLSRVYEMREAGELTAEEFAERKSFYQSSLTKMQGTLQIGRATRDARRAEVIDRLTRVAVAYAQFLLDDVKAKRVAACAIAGKYVLTLGNLEIEPHPVFDKIRTFEPSQSGRDQIGEDSTGPNNPGWRAFLDDIRTLIDDGW